MIKSYSDGSTANITKSGDIMKKILAAFICAVLVLCCASCAAPEKTDGTVIRVGALKGPTSLGMLGLMDSAERSNCVFTLAGAADELTPAILQGELDAAAVPVNLAAVLYNKTEGAVRLAAVNTLGVLYIVETGEEITSLADLRGKTLYATGKGSTPEFTLRYLLSENGLDPDTDLTIEFKSEPAEVVAALKQSGGAAMLPQPYVTVASSSVDGLRTALSLTEEWDKLGSGSQLVTGVLVVRAEFADAHPELVKKFLADYEASTKFVNENVAEAAQLAEKYDIIKAPVAEKAIPECNITFLTGEEMEAAVRGCLEVFYEQDARSVGGAMPGDGFCG